MTPLDPTPAGPSANTYADLSTADAWMAERTHATWAGHTDDDKAAALVQATRLLDTLPWVGVRATPTQRLRWPRLEVVNQDGYALASDTIPEWLELATAELAMALLASNRTADTVSAGAYSRVKVGSLELNYTGQAVTTSVIPAYVRAIIRPYLVAGGGARVVRG